MKQALSLIIFCIMFTIVSSYKTLEAANSMISFDKPILCIYRFAQYMDSETAKTDTQDSDIEWIFFDLLGAKPRFLAGGDTGPVYVHRHKTSDGISIWLKQGNGAHLFTIWPDGTTFWSKHNDIFGSKATQQFHVTCKNIRKVEY